MEVKYNKDNDRKYMQDLPQQNDPVLNPQAEDNMKVKKNNQYGIVESATSGELEYFTE